MMKVRNISSLTSRMVVLRAAVSRDFALLSKLRNDVLAQDSLLALAKPNSPTRVRAWLERRAADEDGVFFVIADGRDDHAVGFLQAKGIDSLHRIAELGICIVGEGQGKGFGRGAIALLEKYLARVFRIRKIWLRVDAGNAPAIALYSSCGFQIVGTLKKHHFAGGRYRDVTLMEKLLMKGNAASR
jgi:RimJ/RimL family protein N-acetyltransferase